MQHISPDQARFEVFDSSLSEYAVLGFEFGYSVADPLTLVIWEAQFGDFANGAQIMIDQFISCAESEMGPAQRPGDAAAARLRRAGAGALQRAHRALPHPCAENNMQVANCTTPAQYFHLLRRQMYGGADRRGMRKPLIVFTPKSLLRHPRAVSTLQEFATGGFMEILGDAAALDPEQRLARGLLLRQDLLRPAGRPRGTRRRSRGAGSRRAALSRSPTSQAADILARYPATAEVVWAQEEPRNMGPWRFMREQIQPLLDGTGREHPATWAGRKAPARPPARASGTRRSRRPWSTMPSRPAASRKPGACGWWQEGREYEPCGDSERDRGASG